MLQFITAEVACSCRYIEAIDTIKGWPFVARFLSNLGVELQGACRVYQAPLVRVLMGTQTFTTSLLGTNLEGQSSFVHSFVRVPFNPQSSLVRSYGLGCIVRSFGSSIGAAQCWPAWMGSDIWAHLLRHDCNTRTLRWRARRSGRTPCRMARRRVTCRRRGLRRRRQTRSAATRRPAAKVEGGGAAKDDWRSLAGPEPTAHES